MTRPTLYLSLAVLIAAFPAGSMDVMRSLAGEFPGLGDVRALADLPSDRERQIDNFRRLDAEARRVIALVDADRTYVEREGLRKLLLGTAMQESRGLYRRQKISKTVIDENGRATRVVVPEGVARGLYQMEPWIAVSVLQYLIGQPEARSWIESLYGPKIGPQVWSRLQTLESGSRANWQDIETVVRRLPENQRPGASWSLRRDWLKAQATDFKLSLTLHGPELPIVEQVENDDVFATLLARVYYLRLLKSVPRTPKETARAWKAHWNTSAGKGTESAFLRRFRSVPSERELSPRLMGNLWFLRNGEWVTPQA